MIENAILGHTIGDALGVPFEMVPRCYLKDKPITGITKKRFKHEGLFSDDTSMVLATMQSIIDNNGKINYESIMEEFYNWAVFGKFTQTGNAFGLGTTTINAINNFAYGKDALQCGINSEKSNGNGALMRMLPIALYLYKTDADEETIKRITKNTTILTHGHEFNILGTYIFVKFVLNILNGHTLDESYEEIRRIDYTGFSKRAIERYRKILDVDLRNLKEEQINSGGSIWETLEAVMWSLLTTSNFKDTLLRAVNLGGDTDTIGAITGGVAGLIYKDIPSEWVKKIMKIDMVKKTAKEFDKILSN